MIIFSLISRLTHTSYQSKINKDIRKRARKIMRLAKSSTSISMLSSYTYSSKKPCIYMSNHLSLLDIPLIYSLIPGKIRFVSKHSLFNIPVFGRAIKYAGIISIDQHNLYDVLKNILSSENNHSFLWIFPEGHRSTEGKLLNFKTGGFALARELKANIIPVGIKNTHLLLPAHTFQLKRGIPTEIRIGEPIDTSYFQKPQQLMDLVKTVHQKIAALIE